MGKIDLTGTLKASASDVCRNLPLLAGVMAIVMLPNVVFIFLSLPAASIFVINTAYGALLQGGMFGIFLAIAEGRSASLSDLLARVDLFWKYLVAHFLLHVIVIGGVVMLVVPGIIWVVRFANYVFPIVDENAGPLQAMKRSHELSRGHWWQLFWFYALIFAIIIALAIAATLLSLPAALILPPGAKTHIVHLVTTIATAVIAPFIGIACARVYLNLKAGS